MTREIHLYLDERGGVEFVHDDDVMEALADLGRSATARASHVEPLVTGLRRGATKWEIRLEPTLGDEFALIGPYASRAAALEAERHWLEWHLTCGAKLMTKAQLEKTVALKAAGWMIAGLWGDPEAVGSTPVMLSPDGRPHKVTPSGEAVPLADGEAWHRTAAEPTEQP